MLENILFGLHILLAVNSLAALTGLFLGVTISVMRIVLDILS